jgi:peptidoglycan hydrolase CwlO-like protein
LKTKHLLVLFTSIFIVSSFHPLSARSEKGSKIIIGESIEEILGSLHEIIMPGSQPPTKESKEIRNELQENGYVIYVNNEKSVVEKLEKMLVELRKIENELKEYLAERKELSNEKHEHYGNNLENLERKIAQLKRRIKTLTKDIIKEYQLLQDPIRNKIQEILTLMEKAIDCIQESLKEEHTPGKTLYI